MKTLFAIFTLCLFMAISSTDAVAQTNAADSAAAAKAKLKSWEDLLMNKWWIPDNAKNESNALKQKFMTLGKYKTIGTQTGAWGWRDKVNGVLYVDYIGQKWEQKIISLTETEFIFERGGKKYFMTATQ